MVEVQSKGARFPELSLQSRITGNSADLYMLSDIRSTTGKHTRGALRFRQQRLFGDSFQGDPTVPLGQIQDTTRGVQTHMWKKESRIGASGLAY